MRVSGWLETRQTAAREVWCITGVFFWSENGERHILIKARWHIDPQMASGGQFPSEPLQMFSQEISSKLTSPPPLNTHTHTTAPSWKLKRGIYLNCGSMVPTEEAVCCLLGPTEERFFWRTQNCDLYVWMGRVIRGALRKRAVGKALGGMVTGLWGGWCGSPEAPCQFILPAGSVRRSICSSGLQRAGGDINRDHCPP